MRDMLNSMDYVYGISTLARPVVSLAVNDLYGVIDWLLIH
jgi:hypothetical protein